MLIILRLAGKRERVLSTLVVYTGGPVRTSPLRRDDHPGALIPVPRVNLALLFMADMYNQSLTTSDDDQFFSTTTAATHKRAKGWGAGC